MLERVKLYAYSAIFIACGTAVFYYIAGLSLAASLTLAFCFRIVALYIGGLKEVALFRPYRLSIGIKLPAILHDLGLPMSLDDDPLSLLDPTATDLFQGIIHDSDTSFHLGPTRRIQWQWFHFVGATPSLVVEPDKKLYSKYCEIYMSVDALRSAGSADVVFFLRPVQWGYSFGIHARSEWWEGLTKSCSCDPSLRAAINNAANAGGFCDREVVLGFLPSVYFLHAQGWFLPGSFIDNVTNRWERRQRKLSKDLAVLGWRTESEEPNVIDHKYLQASFALLSTHD